MERVTHAHRACPLWSLDVNEGVNLNEEQQLLAVGVVDASQPILIQQTQLDIIRRATSNACRTCAYHFEKPEGSCQPGGYYGGWLVSTLWVGQRGQITNNIKSDLAFQYSDLPSA